MSITAQTHALLISEIMSNPTGDDSGREWLEVYNNTSDTVDISALTISIKGGTAVVATPVSGGTTVPPGGYAIIGSVVSGATKFSLDYPSYTGPLFRSSVSLVNTGVTSIEIKLSGSTVDTLSSYTAAKEGSTLSLIGGSFVVNTPTPGVENQTSGGSSDDQETSSTATTTSGNQITITQQSAPSADIVLYMPFDKTVVAGAESIFSTYGMTRGGKAIDGLTFNWAFGDGGQGTGSSTLYRYIYPGRYIATVEASNSYVSGIGNVHVRVVPPDISITKVESGKYGTYVDITNPNNYELDLSQWKLSFDGKAYPFPKHTIIAGGATTRFSGLAMGFASTTISSDSVVKILFPNLEDVATYSSKVNVTQPVGMVAGTSTAATISIPPVKVVPKQSAPARVVVPKVTIATSTPVTSTSTKLATTTKRDTRIVSWLRSLFGK